MTEAPAAISGDFATYRHIQGRKVLQLVIEVPAEMASAVFAALGTPGSGEGIPVALARLQTAPEPIAKPEAPKERRPFSELPRPQQAALLCREPSFWQFLFQNYGVAALDAPPSPEFAESAAASAVRSICKVMSRGNIRTGTYAAEHWDHLEAEYYAWQRGRR